MATNRPVKVTVERGPVADGIEAYTVRFAGGRAEQEYQCARCGSSVEWLDCWDCGGEGHHGSACIDDLCHGGEECIHGDDAVIVCGTCRGKGGRLHCISDRAWCEAHPMAGRESIPSTALADPRAWDD